MKALPIAILSLLIGGAAGFTASHYRVSQHQMEPDSSSNMEEKAPLYWVAPMDPNYRRDTPGKSPMGMDLIPVYEEDSANSDVKKGTVTISSAVENNLGVRTASATMNKLTPQIDTVGYINFDENRFWQTNTRVSGWIERLYVNAVGERVAKGDVLFTLYSPELVKAQEELLSAYRSGRQRLINGARERLVSLGLDNSQISQIVNRGQASQSVAVKAPADGVISQINSREGGYISPAQTVIKGGSLEQVWVDIEVFERQSHWIKTGTTATMTLSATPGRVWNGSVDFVYPILNAQTRTLRVRLIFMNKEGLLKPNMFASVALKPESEASVLTIPREAVIRSGNMTRVVLAEGDGKYRSARINIGREANERVEVLEGLSQGDLVVTSAQFMLDSESSQTAELARINGTEAPATQVWAKGNITKIMADQRMATINHQAVKEWDWPGMVMNFSFAEGLDMSGIQIGQAIDFAIHKTASGQYEVLEYTLDHSATVSEQWVKGHITMLMVDFDMLTVSHEAIPAWDWGSGQINFSVGDAIDLSSFSEGQPVRMLIDRTGGEPRLTTIESMGESQ